MCLTFRCCPATVRGAMESISCYSHRAGERERNENGFGDSCIHRSSQDCDRRLKATYRSQKVRMTAKWYEMVRIGLKWIIRFGMRQTMTQWDWHWDITWVKALSLESITNRCIPLLVLRSVLFSNLRAADPRLSKQCKCKELIAEICPY